MKIPRLICSKHDEIYDICEDILGMNFDKPFKTKLKRSIKKIMVLTEAAKEDGQEMENRLGDYFEAIKGLGFKRDKK